MDIKSWRHFRFNLSEELAELEGPMVAVELANHLATFSIQGRKQ